MLSHPLGRAWHERSRSGNPVGVAHPLPDAGTLAGLTRGLPLRLRSFEDDENMYLVLLQVISVPPTSIGSRFFRS